MEVKVPLNCRLGPFHTQGMSYSHYWRPYCDRCRTPIKVLFVYFTLCRSVMFIFIYLFLLFVQHFHLSFLTICPTFSSLSFLTICPTFSSIFFLTICPTFSSIFFLTICPTFSSIFSYYLSNIFISIFSDYLSIKRAIS